MRDCERVKRNLNDLREILVSRFHCVNSHPQMMSVQEGPIGLQIEFVADATAAPAAVADETVVAAVAVAVIDALVTSL